jgi:hypothetical protein
MNVIPLPAFQDNHLWLLHDGRRAPAADPGDAQPVLARLQRDGLQLGAILVTHQHRGQTGFAPGTPAGAADHDNVEQVHSLRRCGALRARSRPTLPATIWQGKPIHPFLRTRRTGAAQAPRAHGGATPPDEAAVFATVRQWKNEFK